MTWLEQFTANYKGQSDEAKELDKFVKSNYKGNKYIPWATMERLVYMQDPDADFDVALNDNGTPLFTASYTIESFNETSEKKVASSNVVVLHFVSVKMKFLDKVFEEIYPVQDTSYGAPKAVDQNMVNKAIQRAKTKLASRATGLALTLYEFGDLQFED